MSGTPAISSYEINLLIQHYLQELGYDHAAFAFAVESRIPSHPIAERPVPPGSLVYLVQKGIMYSIIAKAADAAVQSPNTASSEMAHLTSFLKQSEEMIQEGFDATTWSKLLCDPEAQEHPIFYLDDRSSLVLSGHEKPVTVTIWSSDDKFLATGSADGRVVVWGYDESCRQMLDQPAAVDAGGRDITAMAWGAEHLFVGTFDGAVICYNPDLTEVWRSETRKEPIVAVDVGKAVVVGDCAGTVMVLGDDGSVTTSWDLSGDLVDALWCSETELIAAVGDTVYGLTPGEAEPKVVVKARGAVAQVVLDSKKEFAVVGDDAGYVTVVELGKGEVVLEQMFHTNGVCSLSFAKDAPVFVTGGRDGFVKLYDISKKEEEAFEGHAKTVYAVACDKQAKFIATVGAEKIMNVWWASTKQVAVSFLSETRPVVQMTWSNNGQFLTVGLDNGDVSVLDFSQICQ